MQKKLVIGLMAAAATLGSAGTANAAVFYDFADAIKGITLDTNVASDVSALSGLALASSHGVASGCFGSITCVIDVKVAGGDDYILLTAENVLKKNTRIVATDVSKVKNPILAAIDKGLVTLDTSKATGNSFVVATSAVPEPSTWAMMLVGFGLVGFGMRKRSNVRTTASYA
ncbi:PEPxxWA-CTERM sorting domain-containing protein [Novosphingobium sp.]|uniref:PEPxxWA-CTERM sorting domain-containing protein n=1 Tax=Novosphingobium sp. TaxID=1874826 RepID=UPI003D0AA8F3